MRTPAITPEDIEHLARLSRLELTATDAAQVKENLNQILDHVSVIQGLNVDGLEAMARPHEATNQLDRDEPGPALDRATLLALAPASSGSFLAVPRVFDEGRT